MARNVNNMLPYEWLEPFIVFWNWMRTYEMNIFGFQFSFMDVFVWVAFAVTGVWFIKRLLYWS